MTGRVIAIVALKGGAAKSTTAVNLGAALAARGRTVLLIDLDPQRDLSHSLKAPAQDGQSTLSDVLRGDASLADVVQEVQGFALAPAGRDLAHVETQITHEALRPALAVVRRHYEYILLDTPRGLGMLTLNALHVASQLLLPTPTEFLALCQLDDLLARLPGAADFNPKLQVLGILPTMYVGQTLAGQEAHAHIIEKFGRDYRIFDPIPRSVRFQEASIAGVPLFAYVPDHPGARAYKNLAQEIDR